MIRTTWGLEIRPTKSTLLLVPKSSWNSPYSGKLLFRPKRYKSLFFWCDTCDYIHRLEILRIQGSCTKLSFWRKKIHKDSNKWWKARNEMFSRQLTELFCSYKNLHLLWFPFMLCCDLGLFFSCHQKASLNVLLNQSLKRIVTNGLQCVTSWYSLQVTML